MSRDVGVSKLTPQDWLEFAISGIPGIDWYYALSHKATRVEEILFPRFVRRPWREWLIATAEHLLYFILGFLFVYLVSLESALVVGFLAIYIIIPLEFVYFRHASPLFSDLDWRRLAITALWNMFNVSLYWILGAAIALWLGG